MIREYRTGSRPVTGTTIRGKYRGVEQLGSSLGERAKTIEYRFCEVIPHKARRFQASLRSEESDYAPAAARSDNPEGYEMGGESLSRN